MPRGRKEGSSSGKRQIFWVCIAKKSDDVLVEKIYSSNLLPDDDIKIFTEDKASEIFESTHGFKPIKIIGPCYDVKSFNKNEKVINNNPAVKENINKTNISSVLGRGSYNGWIGTVFSIKDKLDEVLFIASERTDENINKILPLALPIKKEMIKFI